MGISLSCPMEYIGLIYLQIGSGKKGGLKDLRKKVSTRSYRWKLTEKKKVRRIFSQSVWELERIHIRCKTNSLKILSDKLSLNRIYETETS